MRIHTDAIASEIRVSYSLTLAVTMKYSHARTSNFTCSYITMLLFVMCCYLML